MIQHLRASLPIQTKYLDLSLFWQAVEVDAYVPKGPKGDLPPHNVKCGRSVQHVLTASNIFQLLDAQPYQKVIIQ